MFLLLVWLVCAAEMAAQRPALPLPIIRMSVSVGSMLVGVNCDVDVGRVTFT